MFLAIFHSIIFHTLSIDPLKDSNLFFDLNPPPHTYLEKQGRNKCQNGQMKNPI